MKPAEKQAEPSVARPPLAAPASPAQPIEASAAKATLPPRLSELFRLSSEEGRIVDVLQHAGTCTAAQLATELSLPLPQLLSLLAPEGVLRGRALVELPESAALGWAIPSDVLQIGRGLSCVAQPLRGGPTVDERTLFLAALPGLSYLPAPPADGVWVQDVMGPGAGDRTSEKMPQNIVDLVREHLVSAQPVLLSLGGASPDQVAALSQVVRQRLQRPVVVVDGSALSGWPVPQVAQALRRLRRDTDLRGAVLVLHELRGLGSAWRAALLPRPTGQTAPLIVVNDGPAQPLGALPVGPRGEPGWAVVSVVLRTQVLPPAGPVVSSAVPTAAGPEAADEHEDPAVAASRQEARRQAAIDAARAMGRPVPKELLVSTPAASAKAAAQPAASAAPSAAAPPRSSPAVEVAAAPAPAAAIKTAPPAPAAAAEGAPRRPVNPRLAAALAAAGLPPPGSDDHIDPEYARRRAARLQAASAAASPAPTAPPATVVAAAVPDVPAVAAPTALPASGGTAAPVGSTAAAAAAAAAVAGVDAAASGLSTAAAVVEEDGPPLPLEADVSLDELIRVARTTPNTAQRVEVLRRLMGSRHSAIIHLFRHFVGSPIAAVREAAEQGMSSIFGPHWNRSRAIAPPVQPPRSEDGGRGPGGAF